MEPAVDVCLRHVLRMTIVTESDCYHLVNENEDGLRMCGNLTSYAFHDFLNNIDA